MLDPQSAAATAGWTDRFRFYPRGTTSERYLGPFAVPALRACPHQLVVRITAGVMRAPLPLRHFLPRMGFRYPRLSRRRVVPGWKRKVIHLRW